MIFFYDLRNTFFITANSPTFNHASYDINKAFHPKSGPIVDGPSSFYLCRPIA